MALLLVRHAKAGSRHRWHGDDRDRPLSPPGRRQAEQLVARLDGYRPGRVLSSPYLRCVQTVTPLARAWGTDVVVTPDLAEGATKEGLRLARRLMDDDESAVLCTHGDIVPVILEAAADDGVDLGLAPVWPKASTWILHAEGNRWAQAEYLPPPSV